MRRLLTDSERECVHAILNSAPELLLTNEVGKRVRQTVYCHRSAVQAALPLSAIDDAWQRFFVGDSWNVIKMDRNSKTVGVMCYPRFDHDAHPMLASALSFSLAADCLQTRRYDQAKNCPILHRKELFVLPSDPSRTIFANLTKQEEWLGLLEDPSRIGFRDQWLARLNEKHVRIIGHTLEVQVDRDN